MQKRTYDEKLRKILADNIKECCEGGKNGTNIEIAEKLHITDRQLLRYKKGTSEPPATIVYLMAEIFNYDVKRMFMTDVEWNNYIQEIYQ